MGAGGRNRITSVVWPAPSTTHTPLVSCEVASGTPDGLGRRRRWRALPVWPARWSQALGNQLNNYLAN